MDTIYKYNFDIQDEWHITTFKGATPLHVGLDPTGSPAIWFRVNTLAITETRRMFIVGTGNPMPVAAAHYVGSFTENRFVWHIWIA